MTERDEFDLALERLAARTAELREPAGFADRIMAVVDREPVERPIWVARGVVLAVLSAAAAATIWISSSAQHELDAAALSSFDVVELEQ